jgi:hypothetical protein
VILRVALLVLLLGSTPIAARVNLPPGNLESGGEHRRLMTPHGAIHIWTPAGYDARKAGVVIYIHGFYTNADDAWTEHRLAQQFASSKRNALFIVPEAPGSARDPISWRSLDALLRTVKGAGGKAIPTGPLVVAGHSGAFHTMVPWLGNPSIKSLLMIDALYRYENEFARWLARGSKKAPRQMILIGQETQGVAEAFTRRFADTAKRPEIPDRLEQFSPRERNVVLLYMKSQYDHMDLVTTGRVLPLLLQLTRLPSL